MARFAEIPRNAAAAVEAADRLTPLLSHEAPASVVAYRGGRAIEACQFLADARRLAERLPEGGHLLNVCADRYHFAVGLAACLLSGKVTLLPSTHTPEFIKQLAEFAPDAICLTDQAGCDIDLPRLLYPRDLDGCGLDARERAAAAAAPRRVPEFSQEQVAAIVFTSGSTGTPLPYRKSWDGSPAVCATARRGSGCSTAGRTP